MPRPIRYLFLVVLLMVVATGCGKNGGKITDPDIAKFVAAKRIQAQELAAAQTNVVPDKIWKFFDAVERNDFKAATNLSTQLSFARYPGKAPSEPLAAIGKFFGYDPTKPPPTTGYDSELRWVIYEVAGAYVMLNEWEGKRLRRFAHDVIGGMSTNSILFCGTHAMQLAVSAYSESHREGRPIFTLSQTALADYDYMTYLRGMYGQRIQVATEMESGQAFKAVLDEPRGLAFSEFVLPKTGWFVVRVGNRATKIIMHNNPDREIFFEAGPAIGWAYPHLEPQGLIFKLHQSPLKELGESIVARDRAYWQGRVKELIGDWVTEKTNLKEIYEFGDRVFRQKNSAGFAGDAGFAKNQPAQKTFSQLRSSIGRVYAWRAGHAQSDYERERMTREADFAFRQALALGPASRETAFYYAEFLMTQQRTNDVLLMSRLLPTFNPDASGLTNYLKSNSP